MTRRIPLFTLVFAFSMLVAAPSLAGVKNMPRLKTAAQAPAAITSSLSGLRTAPVFAKQRIKISQLSPSNPSASVPSLAQVLKGKQLTVMQDKMAGEPVSSIIWNEHVGVPRAIALKYSSAPKSVTTQGVQDPLLGAQEFFAANNALLHINNPAAEFAFTKSEQDNDGMTHIRFQQQYAGIELWASEVYLHTQADGRVVLFNGAYHPTPSKLNTVPAVNAGRALTAVDQDLAAHGDKQSLTREMANVLQDNGPSAKLVIWHDRASLPHLVWFVEERTGLDRDWYYFVDAQTGAVLHSYNNVAQDAPTTGTANDLNGTSRTFGTYFAGSSYYMIDASQPMYDPANSQIPQKPQGAIVGLDLQGNDLTAQSMLYYVKSNDNTWTDPAAVSAHYNAMVVYNYFRTVFGRSSIDGNGMTIYSVVHATKNGAPMENAFWSGTLMCYGDGNTKFKPLAGGFDVAAHEMTHGVTQHTANLIYENQSGALNESMSDAFAASVDSANWTIGEQVIKDLTTYPSGSLRNMQDPHNGVNIGATAWQPGTMEEFVNTTGDNGGVHVNSGIPNNAFYRVATAIGRSRASAIWYKALTSYLTSSSEFVDGRIATLSAAKQLFGEPSAEVTAVRNAWDAVGVTDGTPPPPPPPSQIVGDNWILVVNTAASDPNSVYMAKPILQSNSDLYPLSRSGVLTKPAVSDTSGVVVFVGTDFRLRGLVADAGAPSEIVLDTNSVWGSVAIGPGLNSIALTSRFVDTTIYYIDFVSDKIKTFKIHSTAPDGTPIATALYSNGLSFDPTGQFLLFDAFNGTVTAQQDTISFWTMNLLDVTTGDMRSIFPPQPEGISVLNPSFSKTLGYRFVFDYWDEKGHTGNVMGGDFYTGMARPIVSSLPAMGYPTLSGDSRTLAYHTIVSPGGTNQHAIRKVGIDSTGMNATGSPGDYIIDATFPVWFVIGSRVSGVDSQPQNGLPAAFTLSQNYPNPFNPSTIINYTIAGTGVSGVGTSRVSLVVYDILGREVATLVNERETPGTYEVKFNAGGLSSGVYFYRLNAGSYTQTRAMLLVR